MKRRPAGFSLLELVVVIAIVSTLAAVLFERMLLYQEQVEKTVMEQTAGIIRSALTIEVAGMIARGRNEEIPLLLEENPMGWLAETPDNYAGELFEPRPGDVPPGHWYFDRKDRYLVYLVDHGAHFVPDPGGRKWVRYRLRLVYHEPRQRSGAAAAQSGVREIGGIVLEPVEKYSWAPD